MRVKDPAKTALIHEAALRLVVQRGMDGLRMADIAREAGLATGTVYVYFADKEALLASLFAAANAHYLEHLPQAPAEPVPFRTQFRSAFTGALNYWVNHYAEALFASQYRYSSFSTPAEKTALTPAESYFEQLLSGARKQLLVKSLDSGLMLCAITGLLQQSAMYCINKPQPLTKPFIEKIFALCWDALKA